MEAIALRRGMSTARSLVTLILKVTNSEISTPRFQTLREAVVEGLFFGDVRIEDGVGETHRVPHRNLTDRLVGKGIAKIPMIEP